MNTCIGAPDLKTNNPIPIRLLLLKLKLVNLIGTYIMELIVEATGITNRLPVLIPPPQGCC
jgi:hypothetical protein